MTREAVRPEAVHPLSDPFGDPTGFQPYRKRSSTRSVSSQAKQRPATQALRPTGSTIQQRAWKLNGSIERTSPALPSCLFAPSDQSDLCTSISKERSLSSSGPSITRGMSGPRRTRRTGWRRHIFPPGSMVTMENRPLVNDSYRPTAVSLSHELVGAVFSRHTVPPAPLRPCPEGTTHQPSAVFDLIKGTLEDHGGLPDAIYRHRLLEPLVWLQQAGVRLTVGSEDHPLAKVRRPDPNRSLSHSCGCWKWQRIWHERSNVPTLAVAIRSRLFQHSVEFTLGARLGLLQTTTLDPISKIALECGSRHHRISRRVSRPVRHHAPANPLGGRLIVSR